jgi:integrase
MAAIKVTLRQKPISGNRKSLYLDFYPPIPHPETGQPTRRKFLGMYIFEKSKHPLDIQHNKEQLQLAEQIRRTSEKDLNQNEALSNIEKNFIAREQNIEILAAKELLKGEQNFVTYFKNKADLFTGTANETWSAAYKHLYNFTNGVLKVADLNEQFCNDFKKYLLTADSNRSTLVKTRLSENSAATYYQKLKASIKQAYKEGFLINDLSGKIEPIKTNPTRKEFLTIEEVNQLVKTDCKNELLKRAALFSALTGLRNSDILKLTWNEIEYIKGNGYFLKITIKKTKNIEMMPISEQAYSLLGEAKEPSAKVFEGLERSTHQDKLLKNWILEAGITKKITFHCFRHTYATLQLSSGTAIYTVQKMLGHKNIATTQIYAHILDETKREAANKIKLDF